MVWVGSSVQSQLEALTQRGRTSTPCSRASRTISADLLPAPSAAPGNFAFRPRSSSQGSWCDGSQDLLFQLFRLSNIALPDDFYAPAEIRKRRLSHLIAGDISRELWGPILLACLRLRGELASLVLMPEAPVHEDRDFVARQNDVRLSRKVPAVEPEPVAQGVELLPDGYLRPGVSRPNSRHQRAPLCISFRGHSYGANALAWSRSSSRICASLRVPFAMLYQCVTSCRLWGPSPRLPSS